MKKDKKIAIVITIMVSIIMTYGISKIFVLKKENKEIIKEVKKDKTFAIMIQNGKTYKEYTSKENKWPDDNYIFSKAECVDNAGNRIEDAITFNNEARKATLKSKKTIYCTLYFDESNIIKLRENEKLLNKDNLSYNLQGGMYRYQGTDDVANWICFGTTDLSECTDETDNDGNNIPDGIDKYMYRIIGITPNGELYLIKETFIKEGEVTGFSWNLKYQFPDCLGENCEWPNVDLYKRLNGDYSNGNPVFINNQRYEYMTNGNNWYNLIADHEWMYGDTNIKTDSIRYNGNEMYAIETGKTSTNRLWPDEGQTTCSSDSPCTEKKYIWSKSINAKIGLMYVHDVDYAYTNGNPKNKENVVNSWIHFQKDKYNLSMNLEWLITRYGVNGVDNWYVSARIIRDDGLSNNYGINGILGVRPVFYVLSNAKIASGDGTKENPFILNV